MGKPILFAKNPRLPVGSAICHGTQHNPRDFEARTAQSYFDPGQSESQVFILGEIHTIGHITLHAVLRHYKQECEGDCMQNDF
jgi:hypothetical protein